MEEELGEKRGDFLMTFTSDEWEFMKPDLQYMFRALFRAGCQMPTVLVVDDAIRFSFQAFRQHLRDADDWDQPGLLILKMYRPEDGSTAVQKSSCSCRFTQHLRKRRKPVWSTAPAC